MTAAALNSASSHKAGPVKRGPGRPKKIVNVDKHTNEVKITPVTQKALKKSKEAVKERKTRSRPDKPAPSVEQKKGCKVKEKKTNKKTGAKELGNTATGKKSVAKNGKIPADKLDKKRTAVLSSSAGVATSPATVHSISTTARKSQSNVRHRKPLHGTAANSMSTPHRAHGRRRLASLNAMAVVHMLYENDDSKNRVASSQRKRKADDVIDTRYVKRLANLNAQAIMAASCPPAKKRTKKIKSPAAPVENTDDNNNNNQKKQIDEGDDDVVEVSKVTYSSPPPPYHSISKEGDFCSTNEYISKIPCPNQQTVSAIQGQSAVPGQQSYDGGSIIGHQFNGQYHTNQTYGQQHPYQHNYYQPAGPLLQAVPDHYSMIHKPVAYHPHHQFSDIQITTNHPQAFLTSDTCHNMPSLHTLQPCIPDKCQPPALHHVPRSPPYNQIPTDVSSMPPRLQPLRTAQQHIAINKNDTYTYPPPPILPQPQFYANTYQIADYSAPTQSLQNFTSTLSPQSLNLSSDNFVAIDHEKFQQLVVDSKNFPVCTPNQSCNCILNCKTSKLKVKNESKEQIKSVNICETKQKATEQSKCPKVTKVKKKSQNIGRKCDVKKSSKKKDIVVDGKTKIVEVKAKKTQSNKISKPVVSNVIEAEELTNCNVRALISKKVKHKRLCEGWQWSGEGIKKLVYLNNEDGAVMRLCYPAMQHIEGDIINERDSVLVCSGARKTDIPYVAKISALWENPDDGEMMMSMLWYYRPEQTEHGRKPHHIDQEVFASKHRDSNSVACIEDKCYILTYGEYCRYQAEMRRYNLGSKQRLAVVPASPDGYSRAHRLPSLQVSYDRVFMCRKVYDYRQKRCLKNPA